MLKKIVEKTSFKTFVSAVVMMIVTATLFMKNVTYLFTSSNTPVVFLQVLFYVFGLIALFSSVYMLVEHLAANET